MHVIMMLRLLMTMGNVCSLKPDLIAMAIACLTMTVTAYAIKMKSSVVQTNQHVITMPKQQKIACGTLIAHMYESLGPEAGLNRSQDQAIRRSQDMSD